jgi:hypothetical protein
MGSPPGSLPVVGSPLKLDQVLGGRPTWWDLFLPSGLSVSAKQDQESGKPKNSSKNGFRHPLVAAKYLEDKQKLGPYTARYHYYDKNSNSVLEMYRFEPPGGNKEFRPVQLRDDNRWHIGLQKDKLLPLYHLVTLQRRPNEMVFLLEGEKCANIGASWGLLTITTAHRARAHSRQSW